MFLSLVSIAPSLPSMPMFIWRTAPTRGFSIVSMGQAAKCRPGSAVRVYLPNLRTTPRSSGWTW
jgi:hypothetical protein